MNVKVSVIIPCFNEKMNIIPLAKAIHQALDGTSHEIIVVDDNSPDGTYNAVVQEALPYVQPFLRQDTPSLGGSIGDGLRLAKGEYVVVMDSDFNHRPQDIQILVSNLQFYDCVSASRFVYGGYMGNRFRHVCSWVFNIFTRIATRTMVTDSLFGFFAIHRKHLAHLPFDKIFYGYGDYCIRLFYYLQKNNIQMLQIPGILGRRGAGEGNSKLIRTFIKYFSEVLKLSFKVNVKTYSNARSQIDVQ